MNLIAPMRAFDFSQFDSKDVVEVDLSGDAFRQNWQSILAEWATRPPFYVTTSGVPQCLLCNRHEDVQEVFLDREAKFSTTVPRMPGYERFDFFNGVVDVGHVDGDQHQRIRRLLNPSFGANAIAKLDGMIQSTTDAMLDKVAALGGSFDAMGDYCMHLVDAVVLNGMFRIGDEQRRAFARMGDCFPLVGAIPPGGDYPQEYIDAFKGALSAVDTLVAERRIEPGEDLISLLVAARDNEDRLTNEELAGNLFAICAAALTTTAISTGAALLNLCRNPDQLALLRERPEMLPAAIEECLRYHGPAYLSFARFPVRDTEIGGTIAVQGAVVHISPQAANYDPKVYPDPLRFDIQRNPKNIMTFGTGVHHCLGSRLARLVIQKSLTGFLERFPKLRLADPDYQPRYTGQQGELMPISIPMRID